MTTTIPSTDIVVSVEPLFTEGERIALAGFLAGYSGLTRDAYALDLRMFTAWCQQHGLHLFQARRADIECFGRDMEARGRARATIARRLCTIAGFYRYAVEEELLEHSPAVHVRRPRLDYESHAIGLDRNEVGSLLVAAGLGAPERARADLAARDQRAADLRSARRRHRRPRHRTRAPHPHRPAQGRQDRHHPARTPHRPRDRPRHRRTPRRPDLPATGRAADGPALRQPDRAPRRPPRRRRQAHRPAHPAPRVHHRRPRRRRPAARRPGSRLARRPANHHALRPRPRLPRPARHLHRRRLPRRREFEKIPAFTRRA